MYNNVEKCVFIAIVEKSKMILKPFFTINTEVHVPDSVNITVFPLLTVFSAFLKKCEF